MGENRPNGSCRRRTSPQVCDAVEDVLQEPPPRRCHRRHLRLQRRPLGLGIAAGAAEVSHGAGYSGMERGMARRPPYRIREIAVDPELRRETFMKRDMMGEGFVASLANESRRVKHAHNRWVARLF